MTIKNHEVKTEINILANLGFEPFFADQLVSDLNIENLIPARVTEVHKEQFEIISEKGEQRARLKSSLFYTNKESIYPTVGDFVLIQHNPLGDSVIYKVMKRKSLFSRMDSFNEKEQVVAANFDYVFIMTSLNKDFNIKKMERYLAQSWQSGAMPVIILTKADLCEDPEPFIDALESIAFGVPIVTLSSVTKEGFESLETYIQPGKTIVFLGSSGVGKSSLVNALAESDFMETGGVRASDDRGKHTTTYRQLIQLDCGAMVVDTPGMRELGLWGNEEGLNHTFEDIDSWIQECKFKNCTHGKEPGCAIQTAIKAGQLDINRWQRYLKLKKEMRYAAAKERRTERLKNKSEKVSSKKERGQGKNDILSALIEDTSLK